ncbi:hypothetical protein Tco_0517798 [Tanacetum coccineum]
MNTVTTSVNKDNNDDSIKDNTSTNVENNNKRVPAKINDIERQIFEGKLVLLGYDGILVKLVNTDAQASAKHSSEVSFRIALVGSGADVVILLDSVHVVHERFSNSV